MNTKEKIEKYIAENQLTVNEESIWNFDETIEDELLCLISLRKSCGLSLYKWLGVRAANYIAGTIVGNLLKFSGLMKVGDVAANLWDRYDINPNNNRLNALWGDLHENI